MRADPNDDRLERLISNLSRMWQDPRDHLQIANVIRALDVKYALGRKMAIEPGVGDIIRQMLGRLARSFEHLSDIQGKQILDIACGSNTSRAPAALQVNTPFGEITIRRSSKGYTAQFEPWFCRMLLELGGAPVGVDSGDLEQEAFIHHRVDLGKNGSLDFLPDHLFDAVQDSRLFGSPEFTAQFPNPADHVRVAREIRRQEHRLLKPNGVVIHSDAAALLR